MANNEDDSINNIADLRTHALQTLKKLGRGKIELAEAAVSAKLYDSVISCIKTEMDYNKMLGVQRPISFLEDEHNSPQLEKPKGYTRRALNPPTEDE